MTISESKKLLRKELRSSLSLNNLILFSENVSHVQKFMLNFCSVGFYMPLPGELDLEILWQFFWSQSHKTMLPKIISHVDIQFFSFDATTEFCRTEYGILEPVSNEIACVDLLFVPGLAFDHRGNRLGRGRGFYDRFLEKNPSVVKVGVADNILSYIPTESHDIKMDYIFTREEFITI